MEETEDGMREVDKREIQYQILPSSPDEAFPLCSEWFMKIEVAPYHVPATCRVIYST